MQYMHRRNERDEQGDMAADVYTAYVQNVLRAGASSLVVPVKKFGMADLLTTLLSVDGPSDDRIPVKSEPT